ncbi:MAG: CHAD domain-containing protein [Hamadaea sp.]|nr:CHAD domain-containing protein [Hamadaea sp.]
MPDRRAADVVRRAVDRAAEQVAAALPLVLTGDPLPDGDTPVHAARVACRRLRSALRAYRRLVDREWSDRMRAELRWLADLLGAARDAEVLRARLIRTAGTDLSDVDIAALDGALTLRWDTALRELTAALRSDRCRRLLDLVASGELPLRGRAARPAAKVMPALARRPWAKLAVAARDLRADDPDACWHRVRILTKRARYAMDAVAGEVPHARRLAKRLAQLQDHLGEQQDAVVAARTWEEISDVAPVTAGRLIERERAAARRSRARFPAVWLAAEHADVDHGGKAPTP